MLSKQNKAVLFLYYDWLYISVTVISLTCLRQTVADGLTGDVLVEPTTR